MDNQLISLEQIDYLAGLSGLEFTDKEREIMAKEVSGILTMLHSCEDTNLQDSNIRKVVSINDLREDVITPSIPKEFAIGQAPLIQNDFIAIPKVVE